MKKKIGPYSAHQKEGTSAHVWHTRETKSELVKYSMNKKLVTNVVHRQSMCLMPSDEF